VGGGDVGGGAVGAAVGCVVVGGGAVGGGAVGAAVGCVVVGGGVVGGGAVGAAVGCAVGVGGGAVGASVGDGDTVHTVVVASVARLVSAQPPGSLMPLEMPISCKQHRCVRPSVPGGLLAHTHPS
jgi:hypothetical protein